MLSYPAKIDFSSRRSPVIGLRGIVATSQPLAVAAGLDLLRRGGNAADAAVAVVAALNVTEPTTGGIGGDTFALYFNAATKQVTSLNGSGRAPANLTLKKVNALGFTSELDRFHPYTVTVPGSAAAWHDLVEKHGALTLSDALEPAIRLAQEGVPIAPLTAHFWAGGVERQLSKAANGLEMTIDGRAPRPGEIFRNPGLARTFQAIAEGGKDAFYQGKIAEAIISVLQESGGLMSINDLAEHTSVWDSPISTTYHGYRLWECPPSAQGLAALLALNLIEGFDIAALAPLSVERIHLMVEAMRLAFADARHYIADPDTDPAPLEQLLSKEYAAERRKLIDTNKATLDHAHGHPYPSSDTVYLTVIDGHGNACSLINSNYMGFGTGIVPKGWGFTLQNRGHGFSLDPDHPNVLAPGKRPYHTIIPALLTYEDTGDLFSSFGIMGGFMQPQAHLQVAVSLIDDKIGPQAALDLPRFSLTEGTPNSPLALEEGISTAVMQSLKEFGHDVIPTHGYARATFGRGQIILRDRDTGVLWGASEPRADGLAMAL